MKKSLLFSAVLAGLMLGSCSSSDDIAGSNTGFNETGKGYINISLNLPTQGKNVSRAANDVTADGVADEYKVNDAALLLFAGANENDAVFQGAYNLDGLKKTDINTNVQISTQLTKVQEISSVSATGKIYAFVLVNKGSNIVVGTDHTITVNGIPFTDKFSDFSQLKVDGAFVNDNLMMTNVPVVTKPGTAAFDNATVLTDVTRSIFKTEAEAKANPAADVEGMDAARKAAILASIAFNTRIQLDQVSVEGITNIEPADINYANQLGYVIKLLAVAKDYGDRGVNVRVHPVFLPSSHPLASVKDVFNAIFLRGNAIGDAMFYGRGAGSLPTASAVVADVISEARDIVNDQSSPIGCTCYNKRPFCPLEDTESSYYVRLHVKDEPGVLGAIATAFGDSNVSLKSVIQTSMVGTNAEIVAVTHVVKHSHLQKAADILSSLAVVDKIRSVIRVEAE